MQRYRDVVTLTHLATHADDHNRDLTSPLQLLHPPQLLCGRQETRSPWLSHPWPFSPNQTPPVAHLLLLR